MNERNYFVQTIIDKRKQPKKNSISVAENNAKRKVS